MSKKITLLGSTGSIGTQSLDVIRAQGYEVYGLSAHSHVEKILQQIEEFHPKYVCMTDPDAAAKLDAALAGRANAPKLLTGPEGLKELAALDGPDVVISARFCECIKRIFYCRTVSFKCCFSPDLVTGIYTQMEQHRQ